MDIGLVIMILAGSYLILSFVHDMIIHWRCEACYNMGHDKGFNDTTARVLYHPDYCQCVNCINERCSECDGKGGWNDESVLMPDSGWISCWKCKGLGVNSDGQE